MLTVSCSNSGKLFNNVPVHDLQSNSVIREWLVIGPFPNPTMDEPMPDGSYQYGYYTDFLSQVGGNNN